MVDTWSRAPDGHLVTAGRYDGLDLAGDVCKLVIITTVPQASSEFERFVVAYLGDATFMRHRVGQRVTQALGRANRTAPTGRCTWGSTRPSPRCSPTRPFARRSPTAPQPTIRAALELYDEGWDAHPARLRGFWQQPAACRAD